MEHSEFNNAVKRNSQRLYRIAFMFTKNHYDAEDIVQNAFIKLFNQKKNFETDEHIDRWLTVVCVNESKNVLKSFFRKNTVSFDETNDVYTFDSSKNQDLFRALMSLPKKERAVVHLFYYEDLSIKEIASILKISESSVGTRLHRARKHLKDFLGDDWINE